jgi:hypothetical protein
LQRKSKFTILFEESLLVTKTHSIPTVSQEKKTSIPTKESAESFLEAGVS